MKFRGRWPERDYAAATGQTINVSFPMQPDQKRWADDVADLNGRSLRQQMSAMLGRVIDCDTDLLNSQDLFFGRDTTGIMQLVGLIIADAKRYGIDPAIIAGALARMLSILLDVEMGAPAAASEDWAERVELCLYPLYEVAGLLVGDRAKPARFLDQRIVERLGDEFGQRIATWYRSRVPAGPIPLDEKIDAGRRLIAELATTTDPLRAAHLRELLGSMAKIRDFPDEVRDEFAAASTFASPQVAEDRDKLAAAASVTDVEAVEPHSAANETAKSDKPQALEPAQHALWRALQMIAALDDERFPRRSKALRDLLGLLARDRSLPDDVRQEFASAAREG